MSAAEIRILADTNELAKEAAELFLWFGQEAISSDGTFRVALSGGSTPKALYSALMRPDTSAQLDWTHVEFFFGDERCVPPDHPESNYRLAHECLFQTLKITGDRVFRIEGETASPDEASQKYEGLLRQRLGAAAPTWPRFHLILLGLGDDGHTASLFPGTAAVEQRTRLVVPSTSPKGVEQRITVTVPLINEAAAVMFLVTGDSKASRVREILEPDKGVSHRLPASLIKPTAGRLIWMLDHAAAQQLTTARQQLASHEE